MVLARRDFGVKRDVGWHQVRTLDQLVALRQAEIQHHFALEVRTRLGRSITQPDLAHACQMRSLTVNEILNGRRRLSFKQAMRIEQVIGPILLGLRFTPEPITHPDLVGHLPRRIDKATEAPGAHPLTRPQPEPGA